MDVQYDWKSGPTTWRQPFLLSAVCYQWRIVCRTDLRMWRNAVVILEEDGRSSEADLAAHISLTGGALDTLTVVTRDMDSLAPYSALREQLSRIKALTILNCDISGTEAELIPTSDWWHVLPPITELHVCEFSGSEAFPVGALPSVFAASIQKAICKDALIEFASPMPCLEELSIDMDFERCALPDFVPTLYRSGINLRKLHVIGDIDPEDIHQSDDSVPLEKLEDISISLWNLMQYMVPIFLFPALRKLSITSFEVEDWEAFFSRGDPAATVREISLPSIEYDDAQEIIPFLSKFKNVSTLTLRGESVEPIIQARTSIITAGIVTNDGDEHSLHCFSALQKLQIGSYFGTGEVVLQYVQAIVQALVDGASQGSSQVMLQEVTFEDCPHITLDVKASIQSLLEV